MSHPLRATDFGNIWAGLKPHEVRLLCVGGIVGLIHFSTDLGVAFAFKAFMEAMIEGEAVLAIARGPWGQLESWHLLGITLAFGLLRAIAIWSLEASASYLEETFKCSFRKDLVATVLMGRTTTATSGFTMVNEDATRAGLGLNYLHRSFGNLIVAFSLFVFLAVFAPQFAAFITFLSVVLIAPIIVLVRIIKRYSSRGLESWSRAHRLIARSFKNTMFLRLSHLEGQELSKISTSLEKNMNFQISSGILAALNLAYTQVAGICVLVAVVSWAMYTSSDLMTLVPVIYIVVRMVQKLVDTGRTGSKYAANRAYLLSALTWRRMQSTAPRSPENLVSVLARGEREVAVGWRLQNCSVGHWSDTRTILKDIDGVIHPGSIVGLAGPSGSGKTTLIKALLGEALIRAGSIECRINGQYMPLSKYRGDVLDRCAYVGAEAGLTEGSILDNLLFGLAHYPSRAEIEWALEQCGCQFVLQMDHGIDTCISEVGAALSSGQEQRLCLARALLRQPLVLILDEATSHLDAAKEADFITTLSKLKGSMTMIVTAHNGGLLALADDVWDMAQWSVHQNTAAEVLHDSIASTGIVSTLART